MIIKTAQQIKTNSPHNIIWGLPVLSATAECLEDAPKAREF
jgi:hypothetical protein